MKTRLGHFAAALITWGVLWALHQLAAGWQG